MRRLLLRLFLSSTCLLFTAVAQNADAVKQLSSEDLKKLIDDKTTFFFLDVREPKEIAELGTMKGYVNIPLSQVEARLKEIPKDALIVTA